MHGDLSPPQVWIATFREGLLSRVGHDLLFTTEDIDIQPLPSVAGGIEARLPVRSLRLIAAMKDGREAPDLLSERDRSDILKSLYETVLQAGRFPHVRFVGRQTPEALSGDLTLCGVTRPVQIALRDGQGTLRLDQRDFGIAPFKALMGTLRVQPVVEVRLRLR